MTDIEKRAHDIAVSVLPHIIAEEETSYFEPTGPRSKKFNSYDITELYCTVYEDILKDLQEWYG